MNNINTVFLDTSIQLDRLSYSRNHPIYTNILDSLRGKTLSSSTYVIMELRRTLLKDLCYVLSILVGCDNQDVMEYLRAAEKSYDIPEPTYSEISKRRAQKAIEMVRGQYEPDEKISKDEIMNDIKIWISELEDEIPGIRFPNGEVSIQYSDATQCDLSQGPFDRSPSKMTCIASRANCNLPDFLHLHRQQLPVFENSLKAIGTSEALRHKGALERLNGNMNKAKGQESCWLLSTIVKVLEAPNGSTTITSDEFLSTVMSRIGKSLCRQLP